MASLIARGLLTSDFHWPTVTVGKQKGQVIEAWHEKLFENIIVNHWRKHNLKRKPAVLKAFKENRSFDFAIHLNDIVECEYVERGLVMENDVAKTEEFYQEFKKAAGLRKNVMTASGHHTLGYKLPLSKDPQGGISKQAVENYQKIFGQLFKIQTYGRFRFIALSCSLFLQKIRHLPEEERQFIVDLKMKQIGFLEDQLSQAESGEIIFIFIHDPDAIEVIDEWLRDDLKKRIGKVFCGHLHASFVKNAYKAVGSLSCFRPLASVLGKNSMGQKVLDWSAGNEKRAKIFDKYKLEIVPSPTGMFGIGGGKFLVLLLYDDGSYKIEKHKI